MPAGVHRSRPTGTWARLHRMADLTADAVVVGGGHHGLVAACVLADAGWDVVLLSNVVHHFTESQCTDVVRRVHAASAAGGTIAIYDAELPDADTKADFNDGAALGVTGTPAFFINGRMLVGAQPIEAFRDVINDELSRKGIAKPASVASATSAGTK